MAFGNSNYLTISEHHRCPKSFIHVFHAVRSLHTIISLDELQRLVPSGRGICLQHTPRVHLYSTSRGDSNANVYGIMKIGALRQGNMFRTCTPSESVAHPEVTAVNANLTPCHRWIFWQFEWHRERERGVRDQ